MTEFALLKVHCFEMCMVNYRKLSKQPGAPSCKVALCLEIVLIKMNISGITEIILTKVVQEHILLWLGQILLHWDYFNKTDTDGDGRDVVVDAD